jgi:hypothetical protein
VSGFGGKEYELDFLCFEYLEDLEDFEDLLDLLDLLDLDCTSKLKPRDGF